MSGLSRTPGKRVWVNSPPRVRIPLAPPPTNFKPDYAMACHKNLFILDKAPSGAFLMFG